MPTPPVQISSLPILLGNFGTKLLLFPLSKLYQFNRFAETNFKGILYYKREVTAIVGTTAQK